MALAADTNLPVLEGDFLDIPVQANTKIYEGSLVYIDASTGGAACLAGTNQRFAGVADRQADNSTGLIGAIRVRVRFKPHVRRLAVTSIAQTSIGAAVYASDDGTFTVTGTSTTAFVGYVTDYESTGVGKVLLLPFSKIGPRQADASGTITDTIFNTLLANLRLAGVLNV